MTRNTKNDDFDFGFSFRNAEQLPIAADLAEEIDRLNTRVEKMKASILPLIRNLMKDSDKDYIYWPATDRVKKLVEFEDLIESISEGSK